MLSDTLGNLPKNVQRIRFFQQIHISQCLHTDHGIFLLFRSNNVHHNVLILSELHFLLYEWMPMVYTLYKKYGGIFLVITEIFLIYLLIPIRMHDRKILLNSFGYAEKITQLAYQKKCHVSGQKYKHTPWYINISY